MSETSRDTPAIKGIFSFKLTSFFSLLYLWVTFFSVVRIVSTNANNIDQSANRAICTFKALKTARDREERMVWCLYMTQKQEVALQL